MSNIEKSGFLWFFLSAKCDFISIFSGTYVRFDAKAIGSGSEGAQQSLQEVFHKGMTLNEAIKHSMSILKQVMEEKLSETNVEVATITKADGFKLMDGQKLQSHIKELS